MNFLKKLVGIFLFGVLLLFAFNFHSVISYWVPGNPEEIDPNDPAGLLSHYDSKSPDAPKIMGILKEVDGKLELDTTTERDPLKFNIIIEGFGYYDKAEKFLEMAKEYYETIFSYEPFKTRISQIEIAVILVPPLDECEKKTYKNDRFGCQGANLYKYYLNHAIPVDMPLRVYQYDYTEFAVCEGIKGGYATASKPSCIFHEIGHFVGLLDEVQVISEDMPEPRPHPLSQYLKEAVPFANCVLGPIPVYRWRNHVGKLDYRIGCGSTNAFDPAPNSVMGNISIPFIHTIGLTYINRYLDNFAGRYTGEVSLPELTIDFDTENIAFAKGNIPFTLSDPENTYYIQLLINGVLVKTLYAQENTISTITPNKFTKNESIFVDLTTPSLNPNTKIELRPFNGLMVMGKSDGVIANGTEGFDVEMDKKTGGYTVQFSQKVFTKDDTSADSDFSWRFDIVSSKDPEGIIAEDAKGKVVRHTYNKAGEYIVTLKVNVKGLEPYPILIKKVIKIIDQQTVEII